MGRRKCDTCYDSGECVSCGECDFYSPLTDEAEDEYYEELIEEERIQYYEAWIAYTSEDD